MEKMSNPSGALWTKRARGKLGALGGKDKPEAGFVVFHQKAAELLRGVPCFRGGTKDRGLRFHERATQDEKQRTCVYLLIRSSRGPTDSVVNQVKRDRRKGNPGVRKSVYEQPWEKRVDQVMREGSCTDDLDGGSAENVVRKKRTTYSRSTIGAPTGSYYCNETRKKREAILRKILLMNDLNRGRV